MQLTEGFRRRIRTSFYRATRMHSADYTVARCRDLFTPLGGVHPLLYERPPSHDPYSSPDRLSCMFIDTLLQFNQYSIQQVVFGEIASLSEIGLLL